MIKATTSDGGITHSTTGTFTDPGAAKWMGERIRTESGRLGRKLPIHGEPMKHSDQDAATNPDVFLPTRRSLIDRLKDWEDRDSWQEFFDTYWKLIFSVAMKAGLNNAEAEEVVQETMLSLAKKMDAFRYDPERCSFKGWLMHMTRLRILDQFRKRKPDYYRDLGQAADRDKRTATIERIAADPATDALEAIWDREWQQNLIEVTMERVKPKVRADHYQMFYMTVIQGKSCQRAAELLGTSTAQVYVARHRVGKLVKLERQAIEAEHASGLLPGEKRVPAAANSGLIPPSG